LHTVRIVILAKGVWGQKIWRIKPHSIRLDPLRGSLTRKKPCHPIAPGSLYAPSEVN